MAKRRVRSLRCPNCRKRVPASAPDFPFCSERCRMIDLGKWASGAYVVSGSLRDPEDIERPAPTKTAQEQERSGGTHRKRGA